MHLGLGNAATYAPFITFKEKTGIGHRSKTLSLGSYVSCMWRTQCMCHWAQLEQTTWTSQAAPRVIVDLSFSHRSPVMGCSAKEIMGGRKH